MVITAKGRRTVARMRAVEAKERRQMQVTMSARQVAAAAVLSDVRRDLERVARGNKRRSRPGPVPPAR